MRRSVENETALTFDRGGRTPVGRASVPAAVEPGGHGRAPAPVAHPDAGVKREPL